MKFEMLKRTSTTTCPWTIIRSGDKHHARIEAMKVILNAVDYDGRDADLDFVPDSRITSPGAQELVTMRTDRMRLGRFEE